MLIHAKSARNIFTMKLNLYNFCDTHATAAAKEQLLPQESCSFKRIWRRFYLINLKLERRAVIVPVVCQALDFAVERLIESHLLTKPPRYNLLVQLFNSCSFRLSQNCVFTPTKTIYFWSAPHLDRTPMIAHSDFHEIYFCQEIRFQLDGGKDMIDHLLFLSHKK